MVVAFFCARKKVMELRRKGNDLSVQGERRESEWIQWGSRLALQGYVAWGISTIMCQNVYAADIFEIAKSAMQQVYADVAGLATVGAVVCAAICLFLMNFSKSGKTVDESRAWLKRIVVCWAVLMTLGAIVTYMESIIPQTSFTG